MTQPDALVAIETVASGPDPTRDAPIALAAIRFVDGRPADTLALDIEPLVDTAPGDEPGPAGRPGRVRLADALERLHLFLGRSVPVGHGLSDQMARLALYGFEARPGIDTSELARVLLPLAPSVALGDLLAWLETDARGADLSSPMARADAAHTLLRALLSRARGLPPTVLDTLVRLGEGGQWELAEAFRRAGRLPPSGGAGGPGVAAPAPVPLRPRDRPRPVDARALEALIGLDGPLAGYLPGFEDRPQQRQMLRCVADALNRGDQLLAEAGTGTGKSLAYLLPAAAWARENERPVVVATHTLTLQDQLLGKDVPLVNALLGGGVVACLMKGRTNYLCRTRLENQSARADLEPSSVPVLARVIVWSTVTQTGDRAELGLGADEEAVWRSVNADGDACVADRCRHAAAGACWVQRARARAEAAHLVVVNHALLVSDMTVDNRLLPHHEALIVDEAHHLEDVATAALGFSIGPGQVREALAELASEARRGVLDRIAAAPPGASAALDTPSAGELRETATMLRAEVRDVALAADTVFEALASFLSRMGDAGGERRITSATRGQPDWLLVETAWQSFDLAAQGLRRGLNRLARDRRLFDGDLEHGPHLAADLAAAARGFAEAAGRLSRALIDATDQDVVWARRGRTGRWSLHLAPLSVAETLGLRLFADKEALVLTSATMQTAGGFDFLRSRLGLPDAPGEAIGSPFDFERAVLVCLPVDVPEPAEPGYQEAIDAVVASLAAELGGRTLVLYTSHVGLQATYHRVRAPLGAAGIAVRGQGLDGDRHKLVTRFRARGARTLLLGTRSFWEGIDVPGEALSCLVVARLPFDVPTDPVFAARSDTFEEPFWQYALPRAVLRFRQGFGRLIRSKADRGVFVVLDSRARSRGYGSAFLDSLPRCGRVVGPAAEIPRRAREFLEEADGGSHHYGGGGG